LLSSEYGFIIERLDSKSWTDITREYNKEFTATLSPNALRKRYEREIIKLEVLGDDLLEKAVKLIKSTPVKPTDLARRFNLDIDGLEDLMDDILYHRSAIKFHQGYLVFDKTSPTPDFILHQMQLFKTNGWTKWAIISDPHLCSIYEQIELLHEFYKIAEEEKCEGVICAGDFTAGNGTVYRGQMQDLKIIGEDKQINYVCSVYPETSLKTYTISGNHDMDLYKQVGSDILEKIANKREDIVYLGKLSATMEQSDGLSIMVKHGEGGLGPFKSYKPQQMVDRLKQEEICDITILGHFHCNLYIPKYRGTTLILPGCFESQSEYLLKKSLIPEIGGCILEVQTADINGEQKIIRHKPEFFDMGTAAGVS
jgi:predicted phosphodiesterase